jgi:GNAT superfamily N-acetyltransferase
MKTSDNRTKPNVTIRPAKPEDFDNIVPLFRQLWPAGPLDLRAARDMFDRGLASEARAYLCACLEDRIIGFCTLQIRDCLWLQAEIGYLCDLVVDHEHRNAGVGTALVEKAIEIARERGCRRMELDSGFHRVEAHRFYEHRGFEKRAFLFSKIL